MVDSVESLGSSRSRARANPGQPSRSKRVFGPGARLNSTEEHDKRLNNFAITLQNICTWIARKHEKTLKVLFSQFPAALLTGARQIYIWGGVKPVVLTQESSEN
jgi:hypothetical protein